MRSMYERFSCPSEEIQTPYLQVGNQWSFKSKEVKHDHIEHLWFRGSEDPMGTLLSSKIGNQKIEDEKRQKVEGLPMDGKREGTHIY